MGHSQDFPGTPPDTGRTALETAEEVSEGEVFASLMDDDCRCILDATTETAMTAREISEECDIPLSTTYRKIEDLTDCGLLAERTRVHPSEQHSSEYIRLVEEIVVSVDDDGNFDVDVSRRSAHSDVLGEF